MKIQEAISEATKQNETCIRRPIGIMKVRILCLDSEKLGILMAETNGPLSGMSKVKAHYELSFDDLQAINWSVATGVKLQYDPTDQVELEKDDSICDHLETAAKKLCGLIEDGDSPITDEISISNVKNISDAIYNLGRAKVEFLSRPFEFIPYCGSKTTEGGNTDGSQQEDQH